MDLKNRIVMPPMVTRYGSENGFVTERTRNYYEARARGGAALLIVEATYIHPYGHAFPNQLGISDDGFIPGLGELVQVIHRHDAKAAIQLHHGGRTAKSELTGMPSVAPSPLAIPGGEVPRELTIEEIAQIVTYFARAAIRARKAGFNGVEIHGAHGYLIDQFLSRASNRRQDIYGGDLTNRVRFLIEIIKAVKEAAGRDYPVWCRINGQEYGVEEGTTLKEAQETARMAQEAGINAVHVSAFGPTSPVNLTSPAFRPAVIEDLATEIKKAVSVPVIAVGRISPEAGERILKEGKADLIAIGKTLLADPEFPDKVASGRREDITPCIVCMGCRDDLRSTTIAGIRCSANAALGKEAEYKITPAKRPRKVLVVGGGPAGMEATRVAALRGHRVILYEKEPVLGGQLLTATVSPHKDRIKPLAEYLKTQVKKLGVEINLGTEVTTVLVEQIDPQAVVLATGVTTFTPEIPGLNQAHPVHATDVLANRVAVGNRVVVIGGELVGCETAEFLAQKGKKVTITRRSPEIALGVKPSLRAFSLDRLRQEGVTLLPGITYQQVTPDGLVVTTKEGEKKTIAADNIVLAAGSTSNNKLYQEFEGKVPEVHLIGDCSEPRTIRDAIADGFRIACQL
ncbi:MAG: NADH:flavin oxidoreductase [Dehalococcoidales bacterium]|jgi:2,4-dienoyl-CoA reductase-like NADH-dependent reductase (Old Yellow Enzyme family)/thioredoxin reductase|nr:NADH:flavin oxidoreductase [Dehalococcoidales bacterium]